MDQAWDRAHGPWPSRASVRVRELSWQSRHNTRPQGKAPGSRGGSRSERLVEEHLSPARLVSAGGLGLARWGPCACSTLGSTPGAW